MHEILCIALTCSLSSRPKAALLFWFFGDFRCGVLLFMVILVINKYKNDVYDGVFLCCFFFPRDVLGEILNLIESVSEGFPTYSCSNESLRLLNGPALGISPLRYRRLEALVFATISNTDSERYASILYL